MSPDPAEYGWWLASRAAGVVALVCVAISVALGLAMAGRVSARPGLARVLLALHRQTALAGLVAIAVHGITLLGDRHLDPGLAGIAVPFVIDHAPLWTGLGVTAGWLAAILGLSYWIRDRIGPARWRAAAPRHDPGLRPGRRAHARGGNGRGDAVDADAADRDRRAGPVPVRHASASRAVPGPVVSPLPHRRDHARRARTSRRSGSSRSTAGRRRPRRPASSSRCGWTFPAPGASSGATRSRARGGSASNGRGPSARICTRPTSGTSWRWRGRQGAFTLDETGDAPVVLLSAGVGATPVLAMLQRLAAQRSAREVWWLHSARSGSEHAFREEVRELVARLPNGRIHVRYSRPAARDRLGRDYHAPGRFTAAGVLALGVPAEAVFHLCGPNGFLAELTDGLRAAGVPAERLRSERFGAAPATRRAGARGGRGRVLAVARGRGVGPGLRQPARAGRGARRRDRGRLPRRGLPRLPDRGARRARCGTTRSRPSRRRPGARCCAARGPAVTSSSTPDACAILGYVDERKPSNSVQTGLIIVAAMAAVMWLVGDRRPGRRRPAGPRTGSSRATPTGSTGSSSRRSCTAASTT